MSEARLPSSSVARQQLPEPLVPADVDLRDFPYTPLFRSRLFGSSFHARATDAEWRAGVTLWLKSWDQVPAGSLPDDDIDLCRLAELGRDLKEWSRLKNGAMRGWIKCSDGRLHHPVVAEGVLEAWAKRTSAKRKGIAGASKRWHPAIQEPCHSHHATIAEASETDSTSNGTGNATAIAQAMPGDSKGREGKRREEKEARLAKPGTGSARGNGHANGNGSHDPRVYFEPESPGEPIVNGYKLEAVVRSALDAARMKPNPHARAQVANWLADGYDGEHQIPETIAVCAKRPGYHPPRSLAYFDPAIRDLEPTEPRDDDPENRFGSVSRRTASPAQAHAA